MYLLIVDLIFAMILCAVFFFFIFLLKFFFFFWGWVLVLFLGVLDVVTMNDLLSKLNLILDPGSELVVFLFDCWVFGPFLRGLFLI